MTTEDIDFTPRGISRRTTTDFIDHRMPAQHPAFDQPPLSFDLASGNYIPNGQALILASNDLSTASGLHAALPIPAISAMSIVPPQGGPGTLGSQGEELIPREAITDLLSMKFWSTILPDALSQLCEVDEPKGLSKAGFSIRDKKDWKDATYKSAQVREEVLRSFNDILDVFSPVELFLSLFPGDQNIIKASTDLTVIILKAVEQAIVFFLRNSVKRGVEALFSGDDYGKDLRDSVNTVQSKSKSLMDEASKSYMFQQEMRKKE
ncbi:hypothetical protein LQW54_001888 [Pestalotiopsis sp. IQ-011]